MKISELNDQQLAKLVDNRWSSSESVWDIVTKTYEANLKIYKNEPEWLKDLPRKKSKVRANRIFVDTEAVINTLIANPPKPTMLPARDTPQAKLLATQKEKYFQLKYDERNVKEVVRKGLRNLYFSRLLVLKPFWDPKINDFNVRALDPRKVRLGKKATKEDDSEFAIEEIDDSLSSVLRRFPTKKKELMDKYGYTNEADILIENRDITYKEAWIRDTVVFKLDTIILGKIRNPYWDWEGLLITPEEEQQLAAADTSDARRTVMQGIKQQQGTRKSALQARVAAAKAQQGQPTPENTAQPQGQTGQPSPLPKPAPGQQEGDTAPALENVDEPISFNSYYFNHFDQPRKPYIIATVFNNENSPIGQTDMITQAAPLQESVDERKRDISTNARVVNGVWLIDSTVMDKADAQKLNADADGKIWGKGVAAGVKRETGPALPAFVVEDMQDSRSEIDNIMAASSAFRGEREGAETKGGRLALVDQSYLRLNELVQVTDYVSYELFNWFYQLAKVRYTEHHYAKTMGKDMAAQMITLTQDDFEDGEEVRVIPGKTLPEDRQFRFQLAQQDVENGLIAPSDYLEVAGYDMPQEKAKNAVKFKLNPGLAVGLSADEMQQLVPAQPHDKISVVVAYKDLPPDGQVQLAQQIGVKLDPHIVVGEKMKEHADAKAATDAKTAALNKAPVKSPTQV
jgi:hypothetical protein